MSSYAKCRTRVGERRMRNCHWRFVSLRVTWEKLNNHLYDVIMLTDNNVDIV